MLVLARRSRLWLAALGAAAAAGGAAPAGAATPTVREFAAGITANSSLTGIAAGPDGNLWFTESIADQIGRITPGGAVTEFPVNADSQPNGIAAGPDGNIWFTESAEDRIGKITPAGVLQEFEPTMMGGFPLEIVAGPDRNLWFTESGSVGKFSAGGALVQEYPASPGSDPNGIAAGPDGDLWFAGGPGARIEHIGTDGTLAAPIPVASGSGPTDIAAGPDGNLWFTEPGTDAIGRVSPAGVVKEFSDGITPGTEPRHITAGPDGNMWYAAAHLIGRITPDGVVTEFSSGLTAGSAPQAIVAGPDGNLWFPEQNTSRIGRINTALPPMTYTDPTPILVPATGADGPAGPYPATIEVEGLEGNVTDVSVRLNGIHHSLASDVAAQLVGPHGQTALLLANSAAGSNDVLDGEVITFARGGRTAPARLTSGIFAPFGSATLPAPAPAGATPDLSVFDGTDPNGVWKLFVDDDQIGDSGVIAGGWSLDVKTTGRATVQDPPVEVPGPAVEVPGPPVQAPPDTTDPTLKLGKLARTVTQKQFRKGFKLTVNPSEPVTLDTTLAAVLRKATIARVGFPLSLFEGTSSLTGATTMRVKPEARLLGKPARKFKARLRLVATDKSGNRATVTRTITVKPNGKKR